MRGSNTRARYRALRTCRCGSAWSLTPRQRRRGSTTSASLGAARIARRCFAMRQPAPLALSSNTQQVPRLTSVLDAQLAESTTTRIHPPHVRCAWLVDTRTYLGRLNVLGSVIRAATPRQARCWRRTALTAQLAQRMMTRTRRPLAPTAWQGATRMRSGRLTVLGPAIRAATRRQAPQRRQTVLTAQLALWMMTRTHLPLAPTARLVHTRKRLGRQNVLPALLGQARPQGGSWQTVRSSARRMTWQTPCHRQ